MQYEVLRNGLCYFYTRGLEEHIGYEFEIKLDYLTAEREGYKISKEIFDAVLNKVKDIKVYPTMFVDGIDLYPNPKPLEEGQLKPITTIRCILQDAGKFMGANHLNIVYSVDRTYQKNAAVENNLKGIKISLIKNKEPIFYYSEGLDKHCRLDVEIPYDIEETDGFYILNQFCMKLLDALAFEDEGTIELNDKRKISYHVEKSKHLNKLVYMIDLE